MTTQTIPSTTDDLIAEIEAAMASATPGYWYQSKGIGVVVDHNDCGVVCETHEDNPVDAIYIAACNPSNVRQLIARIRELERAQRWVPCSERLPEEYRDVPVLLADGAQRVGRLARGGVWHLASYQKCKHQYAGVVVSWFDAPEPPK